MKKTFKIIIQAISVLLLAQGVYGQENDLSLSEAIEKTLENNYGIRISALDIREAQISNTRGNAGGLPTIGFDAVSQNSLRFSDGNRNLVNNLSADLGFAWKIFEGFRVNINLERLQDLEELSHRRSAVIIENSIQDVIMNYYYILLLGENLKVLEKLVSLSEDRYLYEKTRFDIGGSVSVNVLLSKNLWLNDKAALLKQESALKLASRNLNYLMAEKDNPEWKLTEEFRFDEKMLVVSAMIEKMLSNNQSLKNQYINQGLREKERRLKESDLLPDLSISGGVARTYNRTSPRDADPVISRSLYPYANLAFSYDLFTGGTRASAVKIARLEEEISRVETEDIIHSLTNQLLSIYDNYLLKKEILQIEEEGLKISEMNLGIAEGKYKNGSITSFEYRDIQLIYLDAALSRLSAIYELISIETDLTRMTGGFISPE